MRVIQGKYKGVMLKGFDIIGTRPTMNRVKESLFAMIQDYIKDKYVLDLFAGSGALGIEALSMGAKEVVFVDKNSTSCNIIKDNLKKIGENSQVFNMDYVSALNTFNKKFNLVFLDPPYDTNYIENSLKLLLDNNLITDGGIIVCESDNLDKIVIPSGLTQLKFREYGEKKVVILKK